MLHVWKHQIWGKQKTIGIPRYQLSISGWPISDCLGTLKNDYPHSKVLPLKSQPNNDISSGIYSNRYSDVTWTSWCHCLFNSMFRVNDKPIITLPLWGESTSYLQKPSQRASHVKSVSMSWCHHVEGGTHIIIITSHVYLPQGDLWLWIKHGIVNIYNTGKTDHQAINLVPTHHSQLVEIGVSWNHYLQYLLWL